MEIIYVYSTESLRYPKTIHKPTGDIHYKPWYKIGMTTQETADDRIIQQDRTANPEHLIKLYDLDLIKEGAGITAYELEQKIHRYYDRLGKRVRQNREWFEVEGGIEEVKSIIESILDNTDLHKSEIKLKPHQIEANKKINECFNSDDKKCLLAHKPRSGKTFTTIYNIKENNYKNVVILTSYPILNYQWEEVITNFKGFSDTDIIIGSGLSKIELNPDKKSIILLSLQDVKGGEEVFEKEKFDLIKDIDFDLLVIDEVHYGVETEKTIDFLNKIKFTRMLGLSATPTRNLLCGRFSPDKIHNYTLVEETKLKAEHPDLYQYADINFLIWNLMESERSELKYFSDEEQFKFDKFFRIEGDEFYYKADITYLFKKLIGDRDICRRDKLGTKYPLKNNGDFSEIKSVLLFVSSIPVQYKLKELLSEIASFYDFNIHVTNSEEYSSKKLMGKIKREFKSGDKRSLIIAVDQLTTGITLDDCDMVIMMNDWKSVDKYIQASFRCQSPRIGKNNCWVIDFNAARSFQLMWEYQNIISKNNGKGVTENIREWIECVNIFNRVDGEFKSVNFDEFNEQYYKSVLEKPRFNYTSVIFDNKIEEVRDCLEIVGISGASIHTEEKLNDDGIESGKSKDNQGPSKKGDKKVVEISHEKLMQIAKALIDKTMLLSIFTYFKYDDVDKCFDALRNDNTPVDGIGDLERNMYIETLLLGMNDIDKIDLSIIQHIYDTIFNKDIINKKLYQFNNNILNIYNNIRENPDVVGDMLPNIIELVDSYLKPSKTEKKLLGEVFTKLELVSEMLDTLPKEVWSNPDLKWGDFCNGIGNFPVIIVKRLMDGLKDVRGYENSEVRLKHILENMIYVGDISPKNMFIYLMLLDYERKYKMNFYRGSFLESGFDKHMKEIWKLESFDIIVGNPPYTDSNKKGSYNILWTKIIIKSFNILNDNGFITMVTPKTWYTQPRINSGNETSIVKQIIINNLINIKTKNIEKFFNGIGSSFCYYTISKRINNYVMVNDISTTKENILNLLKTDEETLIDKIISKGCFIKENNVSCGESVKNNMEGNHVYKTLISQNLCKWTNKPSRVHTLPKAIFLIRNSFNKPVIDYIGEISAPPKSTSAVYIFKTIENLNNFEKLFETSFYKFIISAQRHHHGFLSTKVVSNIPKVDLSKIWTDKELYDYFNLTQDEIDLIEKTIK